MSKAKVYGKRILAQGVEMSTNTRETQLNNNVVVIGGSGSGKTGGYVVPNIQNITGSLIVADTKRQLERKYGKMLEKKGYSVYSLDFVNPSQSCGYNPLSYIRRYPDGTVREQDILTISRVLCPVLDQNEPIWDMSAQSYCSFLISYCLETEPPERQNLITVGDLHRAFCKPNGKFEFLPWIENHLDSFAAKKYYEIEANAIANKMFSSIVGFVNVALEPFSYHEAECIFGNADNMFDIHKLGREKTVLFLNVSDTDRVFDKMLDIFYTQAMQVLCSDADKNPDGRLTVPVHMILDDFACSGTIPDFDKLISVIRSRDISVSIILQSLTQLDTLYSHATAMTILNNCDNWLYFGSQDMDTVNYVASRCYKTPESVMCMPRNKAYLITNGRKACYVDKITPYSTVGKKDLFDSIHAEIEVEDDIEISADALIHE